MNVATLLSTYASAVTSNARVKERLQELSRSLSSHKQLSSL